MHATYKQPAAYSVMRSMQHAFAGEHVSYLRISQASICSAICMQISVLPLDQGYSGIHALLPLHFLFDLRSLLLCLCQLFPCCGQMLSCISKLILLTSNRKVMPYTSSMTMHI